MSDEWPPDDPQENYYSTFTPPDYFISGLESPVYLPATVDEKQPRRRGCFFVGVSLLVVVSLLGTAILTAFMLNQRRIARESGDGALAAVAGQALPTPIVTPMAAGTVIEAAATPETFAEDNVAAGSAALLTPDQEAAGMEATPIPVATRPALEINRIALINDEGQVETVAPDGSDRRTLTNPDDQTFFQFPAWSPDGKAVAVVGANRRGGGVYVLPETETRTLDESEVYYSAQEAPFYLYWSPDGRHISFLANHPRDQISLNVVPGDGAAESRRLTTGSPLYWEWSADGRELLVHLNQGRRSARLAVFDLEGNDQTAEQAALGRFQTPGISADSRYWAYAEETSRDGASLLVLERDTGKRQTYTHDGALALAWSPTGDQLAYISGRDQGHPYWGPLRLVDVAEGRLRLLSNDLVLAFFWSPDGQKIAYVTFSGRQEFDIQAKEQKQPVRLSRSAGMPVQQQAGFLSLVVVNVADGEGLRLLDFVPTGTFVSQFLPFFDQYAHSHRVWSPDSRALVLPVFKDGQNQILVIDAGSGRSRTVGQGEAAFWSLK